MSTFSTHPSPPTADRQRACTLPLSRGETGRIGHRVEERPIMNRVLGSILAASLLASASMVAAQSRSVQIASLGFQADIASTNNRGDVVTRDVLWARGELVRIGPLPGGGFVAAFGVNERRQVVGWADSFMRTRPRRLLHDSHQYVAPDRDRLALRAGATRELT